MAPSTAMSSVLEQLVTSLLPADIPPSKLRKLRDGVSRKLRHHTYARTNQFEVAEKFETLQEKFMILDKDEFADAFRCRLLELAPLSIEWMPDILDLLLRISDNPAEKTRIEWLSERPTSPTTVPSLTWADLEAEDPIDRSDEIWKVPEYSDFSSDEDGPAKTPKTPPSETARPDQIQRDSDVHHSSLYLEKRDLISGPAALKSLGEAQFWRGSDAANFELGEVQVLREVLYMLQGLPSTLFWRAGDRFEIDKRLRIRTISRSCLISSLDDLCETALVIDRVRNFLKREAQDPLQQALRSLLEEAVRGIDARLRKLEQDIVSEKNRACSTLLGLMLAVPVIVRPAPVLADLVKLIGEGSRDSLEVLEILFDRTCYNQIQCDRLAFERTARIFSKCFEVYWSQLSHWMDHGRLPKETSLVFITETDRKNDYAVLWQRWYQASDRCPRFLSSQKSRIFNIGKTRVFLDHLKASHPGIDQRDIEPAPFQVNCDIDKLLPFSEVFTTELQSYVGSQLTSATSALRHQLGTNCRLWEVLEALEYIYFARNGTISDGIDTRFFIAIDRCDKHWSDRYLVQEILQTAYAPISSIDTTRISIKDQPKPSRNMAKRRQSVRLLAELRIDYTLPWHVANILTRPSLTTYRHLCTFLLQIRRVKYLLERRTLQQVFTSTSHPGTPPADKALNLFLLHTLLILTNTLYDHLTTSIILPATTTLHVALLHAIDIDAMIAAHATFCSNLEHACLLTPALRPLHDALLAILDLGVRFSDLNNQTPNPPADVSSDAGDAESWVSARSRRRQPRRREGLEVDSEEEEEDEVDDGEGFSTFIVPEESSLVEQLEKVGVGVEEKRRFVVGGLRGLGRSEGLGKGVKWGAGVVSGWEMLADRLGWEKRRKGGDDELI